MDKELNTYATLKMKRGLFRLTLFIVFFFLFNQQARSACNSFSASTSTNSAHVSVRASGCDPDGRYLVQIIQNDNVIEANEFFVNTGEGEATFYLSEEGNYQARLFFATDLIASTNFSIQNTVPLSCGDPCNPNDLNCPPECPSRSVGAGTAWYCLRPEDSYPGEPEPIVQEGCVETALGCIPGNHEEMVKWIFPYLLGLGGLLAFGLIVFSGIQILTSGGNPEKIQGAKETITSAITGLLFIILSLFLLRLIGINILGLKGLN